MQSRWSLGSRGRLLWKCFGFESGHVAAAPRLQALKRAPQPTELSLTLPSEERYSATLDSLGLNSEECELHYSALSAEAFVASQLEPKQKPENMDHAGIEYEMRAYMEEARDQMNCVSMRDISEMKALKYPPMAVYWTIEAVAIILQKPTGDWSSLCRMMCEKNLLSDIVTLEVASVPPGALAQLEWYVENEKLAPEMLKKLGCCSGT